jgi:ribosomal protein S18 acetylase RimI-like enzyme
MMEYLLPKAGYKAHVRMLEGADLNSVLALQDKTREALPSDMKMFILPQSIAYFQNLLMRQTGIMVGIHAQTPAGSVLIAQMALMGPIVLRDAIAQNFITYNSEAPFHHAGLTDSVVICKSMAVHPDWRGNDLAQHLVSFALTLPFTRVADHVFAQISVGNKRSWDVFARQGFGIVAAAYDPKDGQPRFIFQKPAIAFDFADAIIVDEVDPLEDFAAIVNLTQREALIGYYEQGASQKLAFLRNRDVLNIMPTLARVTAGD